MTSSGLCAVLPALLAIASPSAQAVIATTVSGVYDEAVVRGNAVDASFANAPTAVSGTGPAATLLNVTTFSANVSIAFAAGRGGVINFDDVTGTLTSQTQIDATYGSGSILGIDNEGGGNTYAVDMGATAAIAATPISGDIYLRAGNPVLNFRFSSPLEAVGFTVLGRNTARDAGVTITYNDGTTAIYGNYNVGASGNTSSPFEFSDTSANDTFFGFQAPAGLLISKFAITSGGNNPTFDDLGFILPIPEPSAALLSALGALGLVARRRR